MITPLAVLVAGLLFLRGDHPSMSLALTMIPVYVVAVVVITVFVLMMLRAARSDRPCYTLCQVFSTSVVRH